LLVNEFSQFHTGYARYGKELLSRIKKNTDFEIAEIACGLHADGKNSVTDWKVYPGAPHTKDEKAMEQFNSSVSHSFGSFYFEETCLDFKPTHVLSIRDFWFDKFIHDSPFRRYYNFVHLAPVDGFPQNPIWLDYYSRCDGLLTYNDWSKQILESYGLNVFGAAPTKAPDCYRPMPKLECKSALTLPVNKTVIGTVMRNQPRKLFDALFAGFAKMSEKNDDLVLYCHTGFPDSASDIPSLLLKYKIAHKVYFTYRCMNCGAVSAKLYQDAISACYNCMNMTAGTCMLQNSISDEELAHVFNCFDVYVQYSNCEGLGIPMIEAAACGVPVVAVDYSAMSDVVRKVSGFPVKVAALKYETDLDRNTAIPSEESFIAEVNYVMKNLKVHSEKAYESCNRSYNWDKTVDTWINCILSTPHKEWSGEKRIFNVEEFNEHPNLNNVDYVKWLFERVKGEPGDINGYEFHYIVSCLNMQAEQETWSSPHSYKKFTRLDAYNKMRNFASIRNYWESQR
jgi:glycosyltransferase involved in cell wall biosynthesis